MCAAWITLEWLSVLSINLLRARENVSMYEIKTLVHGKCLNYFYSPVPMHKKLTRSQRSLKIVRAHFPWSNLYFGAYSTLQILRFCLDVAQIL